MGAGTDVWYCQSICHLYGTLHAAATHVSKSQDCHELRLGELEIIEISIAEGTGADVMAGGAAAPARRGRAPSATRSSLQLLRYPKLSQVIPGLGKQKRDIPE